MKKIVLFLLLILLAGCSFYVRQTGPDTWIVSPVLPTMVTTGTATRVVPDPWTPTPTHTPEITPTQEVTTLPIPTATAIAVKNCQLKASQVINIRSGPGTSYSKVGTIDSNSVLTISEVTQGEGYLWAHHQTGWSAIRSGSAWWTYGIEGSSEVCSDVTGWPAGLLPPDPVVVSPRQTAWGVWVGPGANRDELLQMGRDLQAVGIIPAATVYCEPATATLLYDYGWLVIYRPCVGDCPDMTLNALESARSWWQVITPALVGVRFSWLSASNECIWPSVSWLVQWIGELDRLAAAGGVKRLIPAVYGAGAPELDWVPTLIRAYANTRTQIAWGINSYPVEPNTALCSENSYTSWTTWRLFRYKHLLPGVPIFITEFAAGWGATTPDFSQIACYHSKMDGIVNAATVWYDAIPLTPWQSASLIGQLEALKNSYIG